MLKSLQLPQWPFSCNRKCWIPEMPNSHLPTFMIRSILVYPSLVIASARKADFSFSPGAILLLLPFCLSSLLTLSSLLLLPFVPTLSHFVLCSGWSPYAPWLHLPNFLYSSPRQCLNYFGRPLERSLNFNPSDTERGFPYTCTQSCGCRGWSREFFFLKRRGMDYADKRAIIFAH